MDPRVSRRMLYPANNGWSERENMRVTYLLSSPPGPKEPVAVRYWQIGCMEEHEGVRWCRGHSGPAVDALLAAEALR